jgi:uncharacterized protein YdiU (UPF0061 family)
MDKQDELNLKKRYLLWLYKTTKEQFDSYERKFTQLEIDEYLLREIENDLKGAYLPGEKKELEKLVNDFRSYVDKKEESCLKLKYKGKKINPYFIFMDVKLEAIEKAIKKEFDKAALDEIKQAYEGEMRERILKSRREE